LRLQKAEYQKGKNTELAKILDDKIKDIQNVKKYVEKYTQYNKVKTRQTAILEELTKENLTTKEKNILNKELTSIAKKLSDIANFFGYKDEKELDEEMDAKERTLLNIATGEDNVIENMRNGEGAFAHIKDLSSTITNQGLNLDITEKIAKELKDEVTNLIDKDAQKTIEQGENVAELQKS